VFNEEDLVQHAIEGDQAAFTLLYDEYFNKVYRYVLTQVKNQSEAEDLTQEVFIKALHAIGSYKQKGAPFASWLFRIARNNIIDFWRKQKGKKTTNIDEAASLASEDDPVDITERRTEAELLADALKLLPQAQKEVVSLRFVSGLSIAEVAKVLGKKEGTIKALQFNGMISMRKILSETGNG
jgi:RNA polymerase sigma-70 factor (ECF subfamily)